MSQVQEHPHLLPRNNKIVSWLSPSRDNLPIRVINDVYTYAKLLPEKKRGKVWETHRHSLRMRHSPNSPHQDNRFCSTPPLCKSSGLWSDVMAFYRACNAPFESSSASSSSSDSEVEYPSAKGPGRPVLQAKRSSRAIC
jgi:hypothetical protein